ncbi:MAG: hypothetical protein OJJ54_01300 [Pseudonocardia sp.]|nr:hypothetical protein [Pseudonocardia sp.]
MSAPRSPAPADPADLARQVAAVVAANPAVARLDGGVYGAVATYLPGRRLVGVRIGQGDEPVEVSVALYADHPFPAIVRGIRRDVSALCNGAAVDITVSDVVVRGEETPAATGAPGTPVATGAVVEIGP